MYLFTPFMHMNTKQIRGICYTTVSHYGGEKNIFQKIEDMLKKESVSIDFDGFEEKTLVDSGMDTDTS